MKPKRKISLFAACATLTMALAEPSALAATWTGATDASWATAGNWTGIAPDNTTPQAVVFDGTSIANLNPQTLGASYTLTGIALTSPSGPVIVNNGTGTNLLTLGSGGIDLSAATQNLTLNVSTTVNATQSWNIASGRTLLRSGGTTTFGTGTTATFAGAGIVEIGGSQVLTGDGDIVIDGIQFNNNLQGGTQTRTGSTTLNTGIIRISTSISMFGTGAINLNGGAIGSFSTTGRNIGSNDVNIGGNIQIGGGSPLSTGFIQFNGATNLGGATREIISLATGVSSGSGSGAVFTGVISNGGITKAGSGILTLNNNSNSFTGPTTINAGDLAISRSALSNSSSVALANTGVRLFLGENGAGTHTLNNLSGVAGTSIRTDFSLSGTATTRSLTVNQTVDGEYAGTFVQGGSRALEIVKTGPAVLTLGGAGGHTLGTTISGGTLRIGGAGLLGAAGYAGAITNNATLHFDSTATQALTGTIIGNGTLLKSNIGALTISGDASGFSGSTTVSGGVLNLSSGIGGNLSATGGRLILNSTITGNVTASGDAAVGGAGSSTGDLDMSGTSTLLLTGGATTTGLSFDGVTFADTVYLEFASSPDDATVYDVVTYGADGMSGIANITPLARGTLSDDPGNSKITFTAGAPGTLTWNTGDGVWDRLGILQNWTGADTVYFQGDDVIFDDIPSDTAITLDGQLAPFNVTVENTASTYTFNGTGGLSGNVFFDKFNAGTLVIANPNPNMSGSTFIAEGVFRFIDGGTWGPGAIGNDATLEIDQTTNLILASSISGTGTLVKNNTGTLTLGGGSSYSGGTTLNGGLIRLENNSALGAGTLTVNNGTLGRNAARAIANDIVVSGTLNLGGTAQSTGNLTLSGTLGGDGTLTNVSGITILTGTNTFSGTLEIQGTPVEGFDVVLNSLGSDDGAPDLHMTGGRFILALPFAGETATIGNLTGTAGIINPQFGATTGIRTLQVNQTTHGEFAGNIQDGGSGRFVGLTKTGPATLTLTGANNTYTGPTTITAGTLALGSSNVLANTPVAIGNATLTAGAGVSDSVSTLAPTAAATINLGSGATLAFAASDAIDWTGGTLTITGDFVSGSSLRFGTDNTGLTPTQLGQISATGISSFALDDDGFLIESTGGDPFDDWATSKGLDGSPGKEAGFDDDPDGDGVSNGLEWILGGEPLDGQSGGLVTTTASATGGLTLAFTRNEDSIGEATLTVEYNTDLGTVWNSATIGATSSGPDANGVIVTIDTGATPDGVSVNLPASNAAAGKLFARLKAMQP